MGQIVSTSQFTISDLHDGARTAVLYMYKQATSFPTSFPQGDCTYTWTTGAFTDPPTTNGWTRTIPSLMAGYTLYRCQITYTDKQTTLTSIVNWPTTGLIAENLSYAGEDGPEGPPGADAPRNKGLWPYASRNGITSLLTGDLSVLYSETLSECGIYAYDNGWVKQTAPTPDQANRCFVDVLKAIVSISRTDTPGNTITVAYGTSANYIPNTVSFETLLVNFLYVLKMRLGDSGAIFSGGYDEHGNSDGITPGAFMSGDGRFKGVGASFDSANILSLSSQDIMTLVDYYGSWVFNTSWGSETAFTLGNATAENTWGTVSTSLSNGQVVVLGRRIGGNTHAVTFSSSGAELGIAYLSTGKNGDVASFSSGRAIYIAMHSSSILRFVRETSGVWGSVGSITAPGYINAVGVCELSSTSVLAVIESGTVLYEIVINEDGTYSGFTNIGSSTTRYGKIALEKDNSGNIVMMFSRYSDGAAMTATRSSAGSWSSLSVFISSHIDSHSLMLAPDGTIQYYYRVFGNPHTLQYRVRSVDGSWGSATTLFTVSVTSENPGITSSMLGNGKILIAYTIAVSSTSYYRYKICNSYYSTVPIGNIQTQVGAGIIEVGQNSNGTYIKFSDGTLIQYQQVTVTVPASSGPSGGYAYQYDFATPFVGNKPCLSIGASEGGPPPGGARFEVYSIGAETYKWGCAISNNWSESLYCEIKMMAIGRWK